MSELSPCPFCGSTSIDPEGWMSCEPDGSDKKTGPACDNCAGSTESVERWNTRAAPARCDAESATLQQAAADYLYEEMTKLDAPITMTASLVIARHILVIGPSREALIEQCAKIADPWPGFNVGQKISEPDISVIAVRTKIAAAIRALSPDPGTVAVASAQYRCTCGAEPYCAPNVHAASCPLAISSTHHHTPTEG